MIQKKGNIMSGLKLIPLVVFSILLAGCAGFDSLSSDIVAPTLIEKSPLPPPPTTIVSGDFYLKMILVINKEGKVLAAHLENSSGDSHWDSLAVEEIMQWKYAPATANNKPIQMKIAQTAHVITLAPVIMALCEIVCPTEAGADSVYAALQAGTAFDSLATKYSISSTSAKGGSLGEVDIHRYSDDVQSELKRLKPGDFTPPISVGQNFIIYMRQPS